MHAVNRCLLSNVRSLSGCHWQPECKPASLLEGRDLRLPLPWQWSVGALHCQWHWQPLHFAINIGMNFGAALSPWMVGTASAGGTSEASATGSGMRGRCGHDNHLRKRHIAVARQHSVVNLRDIQRMVAGFESAHLRSSRHGLFQQPVRQPVTMMGIISIKKKTRDGMKQCNGRRYKKHGCCRRDCIAGDEEAPCHSKNLVYANTQYRTGRGFRVAMSALAAGSGSFADGGAGRCRRRAERRWRREFCRLRRPPLLHLPASRSCRVLQ